MSNNRLVTIVDIAAAAGVSIATVSNVLNRRKVPMSEETIRKVEKAAQELGYRRNVMAASLSRRKSL
jgi:LacI family transcriptional regulator